MYVYVCTYEARPPIVLSPHPHVINMVSLASRPGPRMFERVWCGGGSHHQGGVMWQEWGWSRFAAAASCPASLPYHTTLCYVTPTSTCPCHTIPYHAAQYITM